MGFEPLNIENEVIEEEPHLHLEQSEEYDDYNDDY